MVTLTLGSAPIGLCEDGFDFCGIAISERRASGALDRDAQHGGALGHGVRFACSDERK